MDNHYVFNRSLPAGYRLGRGCEALENALAWLVNEHETMVQMLSGDGSSDAHFDAHAAAYGFPSTADARAAFNELGSLLAKLSTDVDVTAVHAALIQFLARFRN